MGRRILGQHTEKGKRDSVSLISVLQERQMMVGSLIAFSLFGAFRALPLSCLSHLPTDSKKFLGAYLLFVLCLNLGNELFAPAVNLVLGIERGAATLAAFGLQGFDLLLAGQFVF